MGSIPPGHRGSCCSGGTHVLHPGLTCEQVGDREWDPITGYRTEAEAEALGLPQFTGLAAATTKES